MFDLSLLFKHWDLRIRRYCLGGILLLYSITVPKKHLVNMVRINIGCGQTPTNGWDNFDNSLSLRLAKVPYLPELLYKLGLLSISQYEFIIFARKNGIYYADATKRLPVHNDSVDVLYSSHMLEHLGRNEAEKFLNEVFRVLRPGGIIRVVVPDIKKLIAQYNEFGNADAFIETTELCVPRPKSLAQMIRQLIVGNRHHQWMYDAHSLSCLLHKCGFVHVEELPPGRTKICMHEALNLHERELESVYVEGEKPSGIYAKDDKINR